MSRKTKIAILADLHYGVPSSIQGRRGEIGDILLLRAVHRLNRLVRPDVTVVLGDLLDAGDGPDGRKRRGDLRAILAKLESPCIVLPGNHDGDVSTFYKDFERPAEMMDVAGMRFLIFLDKEEEGFNASRSQADLKRLRRARGDGYEGPIVALQHVSLGPPAELDVWFNYTNVDEIMEAMREGGVTLSISGHSHRVRNVQTDYARFLVAPALCESPFQFGIVTIEGDQSRYEQQSLALPERTGLVDWHVHTPFAYCNENMDVERAIGLARDFNIAGLGFSEHSGQLYYDNDRYWEGECLLRGMEGARKEDYRLGDYLSMTLPFRGNGVRVGLELDCDFQGNLVVTAADRAKMDFFLGSIHGMRSLLNPSPRVEDVKGEFLFLVESMLKQGIDILAHPFRVLRRLDPEVSFDLYRPVIDLLRRYSTAAEVNFHHAQYYPEFVRMCLENGVKLSLGSDSHNLYQVGDFEAHLQMLKEIGFSGALGDIVVGSLGEKP